MKPGLPESTLRDYVAVIFRHKAVIITTFITVMISVIIGLELKTPVYQASVKLLVSAKKQISSPYYEELGQYRQTQASLTQAEIVNSNPVMERAVKALKFHDRPADYEKDFCSTIKAWVIDIKRKVQKIFERTAPPLLSPEQEQEYIFRAAVEGLKGSIKVELIRDTDLFTITASDFDPQSAAMIANVVSRSYVIFDLEQQLAEFQMQYGEKHQIVTQLRDNIDIMTNNLGGALLPTIEAIGPSSVKIIEQAQIPFEPVGTSKWLTIVIAFFMSIFLGVLLAFGFEYVDNTFKSPQEVEAFFNLPLLGAIPKKGAGDKELIANMKKETPYTQSYHHLSDQVYVLAKDKNLKSILITAAAFSEGSTDVTANLCMHLSNHAGCKVFLIDANLRAPAIHKVFNIPNSKGLAGVLEGKIPLDQAAQRLSSNLTVLTTGETDLNPRTLLGSARLPDVISEAGKNHDMVFVDYADLKNSKDVSMLSSYLDGIGLVVNEGKTRRPVIKALIAPLEQKQSHIIGVILKDRAFVIPKILYKWI